jgi:hypothetical protein
MVLNELSPVKKIISTLNGNTGQDGLSWLEQ